MIDLKPIFENVTGASFIGIDTETVPTLKGGKKNPMQGKVTKCMRGASVMVFSNKKNSAYESMVHRRLEKEGKNMASFSVQPRAWGTRCPNLPIVEHNGQQYLEVIFLKAGKVSYLYEGKPIDKSQVEGLEDKEESEQGGLDDKVIIRSYKAESLRSVRIDGVEFVNPGE